MQAPVEIQLGKSEITVTAQTDTDGFITLGWAHATAHGPAMHSARCTLRGCPEPTPTSRLGLVRAAERRLLQSTPEERRLLDAYARGVNAADPSLDWQASDSVALAWLRGLRHATGVRTELAALASQQISVLDLDDAIRDEGFATETEWDDLRGTLPPIVGLPGWATAVPPDSAAVAVNARRSASGAPILGVSLGRRTGEPELVQVSLSSPGFDVTGLTEPGIPAFWAGRNATMAWALVPAFADAMDLVVVGLQGDTYTAMGESFVLESGDMTRFGPLVWRGDDMGVVLRLSGLEATDETLPTLWTLARSEGVVDAVRAFDRPVGSAWHLVAADVEGHIADAVVGRIVRRSGVTGRVPHDVRERDRWQGRLDRLPRLLDPPMGVVATTGARPQGAIASAMGTDFPPPVRIDRLVSEVAWRAEVDAEELAAVLDDPTVSIEGLTDVLTPLRPASPEGQRCREALLAWNGDATEPASAIWRAWRAELTDRALASWSDAAAFAWRVSAPVDPEPPGAPWRARPPAERAAALDSACADLPSTPGASGTLRPTTANQAVGGRMVFDLAE